jgi:hypothetical protein
MTHADDFGDDLVGPDGPERHERFFDRFVFNLHPHDDATSPSLVFGHGLYPARNVADGFVVARLPEEQRNLRWSTELGASDWRGAGPFHFEVTVPMEEWHLRLADNPSGIAFDLRWRCRTPAWAGQVGVDNASGGSTAFDHLFQSGRYDGWLGIDGEKQDVTGWWGQRDRSRGVRTMSGGQGLHVWFQAQLPTMSVGFLLVQGRDHSRLLLEGAVMHEDGTLDDITDVRHSLEFTDGLDLRGGQVRVTTAAGRTYVIDCDSSAPGGYLAGGGYGGHHGKALGVEHVEHDRYPLDGTVTPISLDTPLTDRQTVFRCDGEQGSGIFEFAHSRSPLYTYAPTLS